MQKVTIVGAAGRMGRAILEEVWLSEKLTISATIVKPDSELLGLDIAKIYGIGFTDILAEPLNEDAIKNSDLVIDFTSVTTSLETLKLCVKHGKKLVIGTTGFNTQQESLIAEAAESISIVFAPNMSIGVNLSLNLLKVAAKTIGCDTDIEILELHHNKKVDAPSGTALLMGKEITNAMGDKLSDKAIYSRHGLIGARQKDEIGFSTIRGGDIVGEHTVFFIGNGERIEISHKATSRQTFAKGAVRAALWLTNTNSGLYNMQDVLGLS